tara:strand:- start:2233 stop:3222 length:990 start_codon:yes stop_codon:yes gene_type:complete
MLKQKEIFGNFLNKMIRKAAIISISGFSLTGQEINTLKKEKPWGVILFKRNISSEKQIKKLTSLIRKVMSDKLYPILIDEEGGRVTRLSNFLDNSLFSQKYFGDIYKINKKIGLNIYRSYIDSISSNLKNIGININTSPVLDLYCKKANQIIGNRSYSENVNIVNELGKQCVKFYKKNKISTIIKHIPGHGKANADSHFKLPVVKDNLKLLKKNDFKCFKNIASHFAMTAHVLYSKIDNKNNATHSKSLIKRIIRKEINFKGILISDDISMKALKYDLVKNGKLALEAGCNLILYCAGKTSDVKKLLKETPYIDSFTKKKTTELYKFLS